MQVDRMVYSLAIFSSCSMMINQVIYDEKAGYLRLSVV